LRNGFSFSKSHSHSIEIDFAFVSSGKMTNFRTSRKRKYQGKYFSTFLTLSIFLWANDLLVRAMGIRRESWKTSSQL
jgi:hypothetical protein